MVPKKIARKISVINKKKERNISVNNEPLSLAKAKKLGLKMARLPLEKYLSWRPGSGKSLTLNQMTDILLDFKVSGDWNLSLKHVPKRKMAHASIEHLLQQSTKIKV